METLLKKCLILINDLEFLHSHRKELVEELSLKYECVIMYGEGDPNLFSNVRSSFEHASFLSRSIKIRDAIGVLQVCRVIRKLRPDLVFSVTIKPNVAVGLASYLFDNKKTSVVLSVSGLGSVFSERKRGSRALKKFIMNICFRDTFKYIFHNKDDLKTYVESFNISIKNTLVTMGSGISDEWFVNSASVQSQKPHNILFPARLIKDKGIYEYLEASIAFKGSEDVRFFVAGKADKKNSGRLDQATFSKLVHASNAQYVGELDLLTSMDKFEIICLPSYREGLPKVLIEALARKRIVLTTSVPGCSDITNDGQFGLLVAPKSPNSIVYGINQILADPQAYIDKAERGFRFVSEHGRVSSVVEEIMMFVEG